MNRVPVVATKAKPQAQAPQTTWKPAGGVIPRMMMMQSTGQLAHISFTTGIIIGIIDLGILVVAAVAAAAAVVAAAVHGAPCLFLRLLWARGSLWLCWVVVEEVGC